jgi:predicted transglutaminase-like cysteine proteinase
MAIIMAPFHHIAPLPVVAENMVSHTQVRALPKIGRDSASFSASNFGRWKELKARDRVQWLEQPAARDSTKRTWTTFVRRASALEDSQKIDWVNSRINEIAYVPDRANWGAADYWATPLEFIQKGGDCEDYAIAKYDLLLASGFSVDRMKIAVTKDHAVLLVKTDGNWSVLDNKKKHSYPLKPSVARRIAYTINDVEWSLKI